MKKPTIKSLNDKLRTVMHVQKWENVRNEGSSGNIEVVSDEDQLLDDLLHEKESNDLEKKR